ncbi:pro-resilin-like [Amyelois transitella]|uniref:pro-resilin-like n=1 Tax=Amyelois transitella TaxID=680683 RepID=UPI00067B4692|nr:pro-resilin-like [Amyelois transitella]
MTFPLIIPSGVHQVIIATTLLAVLAFAEPPPSPSYLPPSTRSQQGYPQGPPSGFLASAGPQVVAARTFNRGPQGGHGSHGLQGNDFARNSPHGHGSQGAHGRESQSGYPSAEDQGYDHNASPFGRNALDDANPEPANYNFGYMVNDYQEGTDFGHHEERQEEKALGEYHVVLPDGRKQTVSYEADERGFKPHISYQDADSDNLGRSGYDSNANNFRSNGASRSNHGNGYNGNHSNGRNSGY